MCDRCELDMLLYGEPARCEVPVWEKGRFEAKAVNETAPGQQAGKAAPESARRKPGREQE